MHSLPRLSLQALGHLHPGVARPAYDYAGSGIGHVHLGVGAFMRAFIGNCNDAAMAAKGGDWGIAGVSLRQKTVWDQLQPQDCLYTLSVRDNEAVSHQLIGSIRSMDVAPENPQRVVNHLAAASIKVVTITVTEKGYCLDPDSGELDRLNPALTHDLHDLREPQSLLGLLVAGLQRRRRDNSGALTIVSCDNLPDNGSRLQDAVLAFADEVDPSLRAWIDEQASFPATMVDRIVPATTPKDVVATALAIGVRDEAMVKTEPFLQWVIEDDFRNERPFWEAGGALLVDEVRPYETAKLQLLNGSHSALAYLGYLSGHELVSDAMRNPDLAAYARLLMTQEISPVTAEPPGMEHDEYIEQLLHRFENASLGHRTWQIAMDGSQKLPQRLLNTIRSQLKCGGPIAGLSLAVAAWIRYVLGVDEAGAAIDVRDPMAETFRRIGDSPNNEPEELVAEFTALHQIFGSDLAEDRRFESTLSGQYRQLINKGSVGAVREYIMSSGGA